MHGDVVVTGGTGYLGRALVPHLIARGHHVRVLTRPGSAGHVSPGAVAVVGDPLNAASIRLALRPGDTVVHLVGTSHPGPSKVAQFTAVDLASVRAVVEACRAAGTAHLVYVSVAQPAPVMKAYQAVRAQGEQMIAEAGLTATIVRPWYVLGPGHWWPLALVPLYAAARALPGLRDGATRLGLVTLPQMTGALLSAVESAPSEGRQVVVDVPTIRRGACLRRPDAWPATQAIRPS